MQRDEARELLLAFCDHMRLAPDQPHRPVQPFREQVVDGFLQAPGFAGFTDDELKGTARDDEDLSSPARMPVMPERPADEEA